MGHASFTEVYHHMSLWSWCQSLGGHRVTLGVRWMAGYAALCWYRGTTTTIHGRHCESPYVCNDLSRPSTTLPG